MPIVTNLEIDKILDKDINISNKNIFPNQNQATIKELFLQIEDRATYEKITKKAVARTCKFFLYFPKQMSMNNRIKLRGLFIKLKLFQVFGILFMFDIETVINNEGILADKRDFKKILILLLFNHLLIHHRQSNTLINLCIITSC